MNADRIPLYRKLEELYQSKLLTYVTSDRPNMFAQIATDVIDCFIDHRDKIDPCPKISLYLYT